MRLKSSPHSDRNSLKKRKKKDNKGEEGGERKGDEERRGGRESAYCSHRTRHINEEYSTA
jgi:hypothetical protein